MPKLLIAARPTSKQPLLNHALILLAAILFALCYGLGAWSTIAFTFALGHHPGGVPTWAFGVAWETARLFLTLLAFMPATSRWCGANATRLTFLLILNLGSTAMSVASIWRQGAQDALLAEARAEHVARLKTADRVTASFADTAQSALNVLVRAERGSKALRALADVTPLLGELKASDKALQSADEIPAPSRVNQRVFAGLAQRAFVGDADTLRAWYEAALAVVVDLVGVALPSMCLATLSQRRRQTSAHVPHADVPSPIEASVGMQTRRQPSADIAVVQPVKQRSGYESMDDLCKRARALSVPLSVRALKQSLRVGSTRAAEILRRIRSEQSGPNTATA